MPRTPLFLALEIDGDGAHPAAWRAADHPPADLLSPDRTAELVHRAERDGFHAVTIADSVLPPAASPGITARLDAVLRAAFAAPTTSTIGLVPVVNAPWNEPFHLSAQISSLDHASLGRGGWLVAAEADAESSAVYGRDAVPDAFARHEETEDVVRAVSLLWDSWEDGAAIRDADSGRYLDGAKVHPIRFEGRSFTVRGPAITPRPPQGRPPIFARPDEAPHDLIDVAVIGAPDRAALERSAAELRTGGIPRVIAEIEVALDARGRSARDRVRELDELARADGLPAWEAEGAAPRPDRAPLRFLGRPEEFANLLDSLRGVVDGVRLLPAVVDTDAEELGRAVLPALRSRGIADAPVFGSTLRETLRLPRPESRFATAHTTSKAGAR